MKYFKFFIIGIVIILFFIGCATVSIKDIKQSPQEYKNIKVSIKGTVDRNIKIGNFNVIRFIDGEDSIIVVKYNCDLPIHENTKLTGIVKIIHIPIINVNMFYVIGEKAEQKLKEINENQKEKFKQLMRELQQKIEELSQK